MSAPMMPDAARYGRPPEGSVHVGGLLNEIRAAIALGRWGVDDIAWRPTEEELVPWLGRTRIDFADAWYQFPSGTLFLRATPKLANTQYGYCPEATRVGKAHFPNMYATRAIYRGADPKMHERVSAALEASGWMRSGESSLRDIGDLAFASRRIGKRTSAWSLYGSLRPPS